MKLILAVLLLVAANFVWADEGVDITIPSQVSQLTIIEENAKNQQRPLISLDLNGLICG